MEQKLDPQSIPSALPTELVRQFVASAHHDLDTVQSMLDVEPGLLHAAMNWGGGDWETALGAARTCGQTRHRATSA